MEYKLSFLPKYKDTLVTLVLGVLSSVLGLITIDTPGFVGSYSDLREIPLLIAILHLRNPLYIIPLCILTLIGLPLELRLVPVFLTHAIPLFIVWYIYRWIKKYQLTTIKLGVIWFFNSVLYYCILLYPVLILSYWLFDFNQDLTFIYSYKAIFTSGSLEMIASAFVSSIYLVQLNYRRKLENSNKNLEHIVKERTLELSTANSKLKELNANLESIVEERTQIVNQQLKKITKYVHMNSHEVRGPLARILGLLKLIDLETSEKNKNDLLKMINVNTIELDEIVRGMNKILEEERKHIP